jgi:CrcB protein
VGAGRAGWSSRAAGTPYRRDEGVDPDLAGNPSRRRGDRAHGWRIDERWRGWRYRSWADRAGVYLAASAGGAVGGTARWGVGALLPTPAGQFPWSTLLINVAGSLLIGLAMMLILEVWSPRRYVRPFLVVGVLGGFTTFSTYAVEVRGLFATGSGPLAVAYLLGTLLAGLAAVWAGVGLGRLLVQTRW